MIAKALIDTLRNVYATLDAMHIPMAIMGGIAVASWRHPRATQDVDLLAGIADADIDRVLAALAAAKVRPKRQPPVVQIGRLRLIQCFYEPPESFLELRVDLLLAECPFQRAALQRRVTVRLPGLEMPVSVVSCEDLIVFKLLAGRILDRADAAALLRANRVTLDLPYLTGWVDKLGLAAEFDEAWHDALPGERSPSP